MKLCPVPTLPDLVIGPYNGDHALGDKGDPDRAEELWPQLRNTPRRALALRTCPGRRFDHVFFTSMALVMLATVFIGFAHTYYLAGLYRAPLPNRIIHVHGAVFSCWILLLVAQTSLVSAGRVDIHPRLGVAGFFLGCLMTFSTLGSGNSDVMVPPRGSNG